MNAALEASEGPKIVTAPRTPMPETMYPIEHRSIQILFDHSRSTGHNEGKKRKRFVICHFGHVATKNYGEVASEPMKQCEYCGKYRISHIPRENDSNTTVAA